MEVNLSGSFLASQSSGSRTVKISIKGDGFAVEGVGVVTFSGPPPAASNSQVAVNEEPEPRKKRGYKRKATATDPELLKEIAARVKKLDASIQSRFGAVVWAKMRSYPYWPAMIVDPRDLQDPKLQAMALKEMDTKFIVCFYFPRNVCSVLHSDVEEWTDAKFDYRSGHPKRDISTPVRRTQLATAIEMADKDIKLPISERMDGMSKQATTSANGTKAVPKLEPAPAPAVALATPALAAVVAPQPTAAPSPAATASSQMQYPPFISMQMPVAPASIAMAPQTTAMPPQTMAMTSMTMAPQYLYPFDNSIVEQPLKKKRGRPVGSKNRPKDAPPEERRKPGRPPGSKTKAKVVPPIAFMPPPPPHQVLMAPVISQSVEIPTDVPGKFQEEVVI